MSLPTVHMHAAIDDGYRPISVLCVISIVFGCMSLIAFVAPFAVVLAVFGIAVSLVGIRRSQGELSGVVVAKTGLLLAIIGAVGGPAFHVFRHRLEVPRGFRQISFYDDISTRHAKWIDGRVVLEKDVQELLGAPVSLRGYVWPGSWSNENRTLLLTSSPGISDFGDWMDVNEVILVHVQPDVSVDVTEHYVSVAGELNAIERSSLEDGIERPIYMLKNAEVRPATSPFAQAGPPSDGC